jgi:hypothetical protein
MTEARFESSRINISLSYLAYNVELANRAAINAVPVVHILFLLV